MSTRRVFHCYRQFLRATFAERRVRNASYSLRAFARDLGLSPSRLSEVMAGKAGLSMASAAKVSRALGLGVAQQKYFNDLVASEHARSPHDRAAAREAVTKYQTKYRGQLIDADRFATIADWRHFAIIEALTISPRLGSESELAAFLRMKAPELKPYVERLQRVGLITRTDDGRLRYVTDRNSTPAPPDQAAVRNFHKSMLTEARTALHDRRRAQAEFSSTLVAIAPEKLEQARGMIRDFWRDFCEAMAAEQEDKKLYCLGVQFFDVLGDH